MFFYKTGVLNNKEICDILSQGAMDCINIFTDPGIIAAKITAYSKRMIMQDMKKINTISTYDNLLTIDINTLMVTVKEGAKIEHYKLTRKQISILSILILNENQPVERNRIANLAYSEKIDRITPQIIDKHIQMIKENIPEISDNIKAVYGVGYVYTVKKNCKRV
jgi:DNA-binding response OmpR family regulator